MKTYVIVPVYNESRYLGNFLAKLTKFTKRVIVVDDGSVDHSGDIGRSYGVTTLRHITNLGKGASLKTGCEYAFNHLNADAVILMDGDDQHSPDDLLWFMRALSDGAHIIHGVRTMDARIPLTRLIGNKLASIIINLIFHRYIADIPSGYNALTKQAYLSIAWKSSGYEVETELAVRVARSQLEYVEIPISTVYHGKEYGFNLLDALLIITRIPTWIWS